MSLMRKRCAPLSAFRDIKLNELHQHRLSMLGSKGGTTATRKQLNFYLFHQVKSSNSTRFSLQTAFFRALAAKLWGFSRLLPLEAEACRRLRADANSSLLRFGSSQRESGCGCHDGWMDGWMVSLMNKTMDLDSKRSLNILVIWWYSTHPDDNRVVVVKFVHRYMMVIYLHTVFVL